MDPFIGQIMMFGGGFEIRGWSYCNGQILAISSNTALFSLIGTTFGGNGVSTFALPDLRGRVAIHPGTGPGLSTYSWGQSGGTESVSLSLAQLPSHTHLAQLNVSTAESALSTPTAGSAIATPGALSGRTFTPTLGFVGAAPNVAMNGSSVTVANAGASQPHTNIQPFLGINHMIATVGIYPSRS